MLCTDSLSQEDLVQHINTMRPDLHAQLVLMTPGEMSFREQLYVVRRTRVLVAFHGAALTHLLFLQHTAPASTIEITTRSYLARNHYAVMARNIGANYMAHVMPETSETRIDVFRVPLEPFMRQLSHHIPVPPR